MCIQSNFMLLLLFLIWCVPHIACSWNSYNRKRCGNLQVSISSNCCHGIPIFCISCGIYSCWLPGSFLSLQRKICSSVCVVSKYQFLHILQHFPVSLFSDFTAYFLLLNFKGGVVVKINFQWYMCAYVCVCACFYLHCCQD